MRAKLFVLIAVLLAWAGTARAHPEGFSGLRVHVWPDRVRVVVSLHTRDMNALFPPDQNPDYVNDVIRKMQSAPNDLVELRTADDVVLPPKNARAEAPEVGLIETEIWYDLPAKSTRFQIWSKHMAKLPRGHQQLMFAEDMRGLDFTMLSGHALTEAVLTREEDTATIELPWASWVATIGAATNPSTTQPIAQSQPPTPARRISFFLLGIEHILIGYDHLLFLAALLLVCKDFKEAAAVITFFTVAHSITLTLAALDIVRLPGTIVEPAIAASIIYVGLENLFGKHRFAWRAAVTFGFGLVHGLGFASALREVGLGSTAHGIAIPLIKFSAGLETGQLVLAAIFLQVMLWFRKMPTFERRWIPAGSVLVALIGTYWLVTRVMAG